MARLYFERFAAAATTALRAAAATIRENYATGGPCTHLAFPSGTGEVVFAFPAPSGGGARFVAVASPRELDALVRGELEDGVDECWLEATDLELEADGIPTRLSFL
jgi:hypothetical protein